MRMRAGMPAVLRSLGLLTVITTMGLAACARPMPVPVVAPGMERFPEYPLPVVSPELMGDRRAAEAHDRGWRFLQSGDLRNAERTFQEVLRRTPSFYPTEAAMGFARLAQGNDRDALAAFDRALAYRVTYLPALVGRAEALLELGREADAFDTYQRVLAVAPDHPVALRRADVLRFRMVQQDVAAGRAAREAGDLAGARDALGRALQAAPDSAFLYRDLAHIARDLDDPAEAARLVNRALEIDAEDAASYALRGELRERSGDMDGALADYRRATSLDAGLIEVASRIARIDAERAEAAVPAEFKAIRESPRLTRGDLAALLAYRLPVLLQPQRAPMVITDARRHWAQDAILQVTRAGAMEVFPNHTFQPGTPMTRGDLAMTVNRVLMLLAARAPGAAQAWRDARLTFSDIRPGNVLYPAISRSVASGVLTPAEGQVFGARRPVTGAEGAEAIERLARITAGAGLDPARGSAPAQRP
jgi:tetratricopeptide (TPR) repeat protein